MFGAILGALKGIGSGAMAGIKGLGGAFEDEEGKFSWDKLFKTTEAFGQGMGPESDIGRATQSISGSARQGIAERAQKKAQTPIPGGPTFKGAPHPSTIGAAPPATQSAAATQPVAEKIHDIITPGNPSPKAPVYAEDPSIPELDPFPDTMVAPLQVSDTEWNPDEGRYVRKGGRPLAY